MNLPIKNPVEPKKYSKNGDYLLTIGHKGEGPGEFVGPIIFFIDAKNIINIFDFGTQRIMHFSNSGEFLDSVNLGEPLGLPPFGFAVDDSKNYFLSSYNHKKNTVIQKYNATGKLINSFGKPPKFRKPMTSIDFSIKQNISRGVLRLTKNALCYSQLNPYEIRRYSLNGKLEMIIYRDNEFMPPARAKLIGNNRYEVPEPSMSTMVGMWKNRIVNCVAVPEDISSKIGCVVDLFNQQGQLLTSLILKDRIYFTDIDRHGKLYGGMIKKNKTRVIVRYALKMEKGGN